MKAVIGLVLLAAVIMADSPPRRPRVFEFSKCVLPPWLPNGLKPPKQMSDKLKPFLNRGSSFKDIKPEEIDPKVIELIKQNLASKNRKFDPVVCARLQTKKNGVRWYLVQLDNRRDVFGVAIDKSGAAKLIIPKK